MAKLVIKYRKQFIFIGIVLYTFLFVTWISYSDNPFLQDDNGLQWNPVIEVAFHEFFTTGHIPQFNFYQLKGYDIFQVGYYGLYNPLMYIAYICSLLFRTNPLCAYTYISFMIGNLVVYKLGRKSGCSEILSLMITLLYSASGVFFYYSYWYYTVENYWMIPLLFLLFLGDSGRKHSWYQYGLWMAFSIYLGNVQFAMYHWMICGITMLVIWAAGRKGYWKRIGTNLVTALAFSLFPLIGLMEASARSEIYSGKSVDFMAYPIRFVQYLDESLSGNRGDNLLLLCFFFLGIYDLVRQIRKSRKVSYQMSILLASMVVSTFFILFMGGEDYLLAKILCNIPGLSSSRYLMKILLILPGCMIPLSIYAFHQVFEADRQNNIWRTIAGYVLVMVCFAIGASQAYEAYRLPFCGEFGEKKALDVSEDLSSMYNLGSVDLNSYRVINLVGGQNDYNNFNEYYTETHNVDSLLLGNLGTKLSVFSMGGYDNTFYGDSLVSAERIYKENPAGWTSQMEFEMFSVRNTISIKTLMRNIYRQGDYNAKVCDAVRERYPDYGLLKTEYQYDEFGICKSVILSLEKDALVRQVSVSLDELGVMCKSSEVFDILAQNGVKYMLYDQSIWSETVQFLQECEAMGIGYILHSVSDDCKYIELVNGVIPIASNQDAQVLSMRATMDMLQISVTEQDMQCNVSMTYNDKLKALYYPDQGSKGIELKIGRDGNHNIVLDLTDCTSGCIVITYENGLNLLCIVQMVLLLMAIIIPMVLSHKTTMTEWVYRIGIDRGITIVLGVLITIYVIYIFRVCLHTEALVPDERWFLNVLETVNVHSLRDYLFLPNELCYGPVYWLIMSKLATFANMRILCGVLLLSVIPAVIITVLLQERGQKVSACFPAVLLCLSAPLTWFTGKIIGPEIMGYSLGVWGCTLGVSCVSRGWKTKKAVLCLSGFLIGISFGIKLNYIVFGVFVGIYIIGVLGKDKIREIIVDAVCLIMGAIVGFICSSPICFTDFEIYISNFEQSKYSFAYLKDVVFKDYIEWDFVNSGGLNNTIISFVAFVCFFLLGIKECFFKKERKPILLIAGYISILMLLLLCSRERFLGWYLLPVIYFVSINLSGRKITYMILLLNIILTMPDIYFQFYAKETQIRYVEQEDTIEDLVHYYTEQWSDHTRYVFVDSEIGQLPLDSAYFYRNTRDEKQILFLSDKALYNRQLNNIYQDALYQKNGYRFIANKNDINVILYEREASRS